MVKEFSPGRRISYEENLCTVRYVGEISGTKGQWLGVEWDEPSRGKHDGMHDGVRYFHCMFYHLERSKNTKLSWTWSR